jgi:hypothetical protein
MASDWSCLRASGRILINLIANSLLEESSSHPPLGSIPILGSFAGRTQSVPMMTTNKGVNGSDPSHAAAPPPSNSANPAVAKMLEDLEKMLDEKVGELLNTVGDGRPPIMSS